MDKVFQPDGLVVGVDPSHASRHAAEWAADRAAASDRPLHLIAARSPEAHEGWDHDHLTSRSTHDHQQEQLEQLRLHVLDRHPGLHISLAATDRLPATALVLAARRSRTVVLGSHGESLLRWSLGSTAHQVAVHAPCSVAIVRAEREPRLARALVGVDEPATPVALAWALLEADRTESEVLALHVADRDEEHSTDGDHGPAEAALDHAVRQAAHGYPGVKVRTEVVPGNPVRSLLHQAADHDLVVVGARGAGGFPGLTLGHVAGALLQRADCTVVIAR